MVSEKASIMGFGLNGPPYFDAYDPHSSIAWSPVDYSMDDV